MDGVTIEYFDIGGDGTVRLLVIIFFTKILIIWAFVVVDSSTTFESVLTDGVDDEGDTLFFIACDNSGNIVS